MESKETRGPGVAFLLSQIGAAAATRFAIAVADLDLTPAQAGVLRHLASDAPLTQKALADRLSTPPARIVGHLDRLEQRGAVLRRPGSDRRVNQVTLTDEGRSLTGRLRAVAREHDAAITASLDPGQREALRELLSALGDDLGLSPGVHPGFAAGARTGGPPEAPGTPPGRTSSGHR